MLALLFILLFKPTYTGLILKRQMLSSKQVETLTDLCDSTTTAAGNAPTNCLENQEDGSTASSMTPVPVPAVPESWGWSEWSDPVDDCPNDCPRSCRVRFRHCNGPREHCAGKATSLSPCPALVPEENTETENKPPVVENEGVPAEDTEIVALPNPA
ncbi:uncharacterized protein LOC111700210 [Eurytemora carolleeae]|uniref:uncharacterized protein LOC111700210 n=1 Tax=Eurytemora carolleeae TaxID=1294199 RepID=UPI000C79184E|nr:uncharacterized protein LOC111700210 [Eurytemora carolleeae]|eukprot:XP_023326843.1 uncharacterized protein LOC111700210 [Eurytemora affinis]